MGRRRRLHQCGSATLELAHPPPLVCWLCHAGAAQHGGSANKATGHEKSGGSVNNEEVEETLTPPPLGLGTAASKGALEVVPILRLVRCAGTN